LDRFDYFQVDGATQKRMPSFKYLRADGRVWQGDLFDRDNPLWQEAGILFATKSGGLAVRNVRQTRQAAFDVMKAIVLEGKDLSRERLFKTPADHSNSPVTSSQPAASGTT
jgi:hypothetical protein